MRTSAFLRALTIFAFERIVTIDSKRRSILIIETTVWFRNRHRRIRFEDVDHVVYSFSGAWTSWDWRGKAHDLIESFSVGLKLKDSVEIVSVAQFLGQGAAGDFSTWMMGDTTFDARGTQEDDSRTFVGELCETLDVPLGSVQLAPNADAEGRFWRCTACGRSVAPKPGCLYCGGVARPADDLP